ncbi:MAG: hypothetical protein HKO71_07635 [Pseudomonadales bacterium]|nr:hypothetical protein [Pseudomonadales bacterium]
MPQSTGNSISPAQRRSNQVKLLVLWLVPFGLMAIAGLCYYLVQTGQMTIGSKNHGVLLQPPVQLHDVLPGLQAYQGSVAPASEDKEQLPWAGKWSIVVRGDAQCSRACRDNLYLTRQLHIRLDKNANRVQRIYLSDAPTLGDEFVEHVAREHLLLKSYRAQAASLLALDEKLVSGDGEPARFFIVDPDGWAMMYYLQDHDGNAMLQDLKHLLKYSRER